MNIKPEWAAFIVAVIALVQPWILYGWKTLFRKGNIEFHETGKIELGFSNFGPTIGILGTYRAINRDLFISSIELTVIRLKNKSQNDFGWMAFRSTILSLPNLTPSHLELPTGFLVRQDKPLSLHVLFNDKSTESEISTVAKSQLSGFVDFENEHFSFIPNYQKVPDSGSLTTLDQKKEFQDLVKNKDWQRNCYTKVDRSYYWEPGEYSLLISIKTSDANVLFTKLLKFVISEEDSKALKLNVIRITDATMDAFMGETESNWKFIYCDYLC